MDYKIITPVSVEPVTLAEAKLHIKASSDTFSGDVTTSQSVTPGLHTIAASYGLVGAAIDVLGYIPIVNLNAGGCGTGGSVAAKIQESDDNVTWQDYSSGAFATVTESNDNAIQEILYAGTKRYIRTVATVAGASCSFSVDVLTRTGDVEEDTLIAGLIASAREYCEAYTRRSLATQTIEAHLSRFPRKDRFKLPRPPLQSVTSVKYKDSTGTETTMTVDAEYIIDSDSDVGAIVLPYGLIWPTFTEYPVNAVKVRYVSGYCALTPIPQTIKQAMLLHIGYFYNNRDAVGLDDKTDAAIKRLLSIWKCGWF